MTYALLFHALFAAVSQADMPEFDVDARCQSLDYKGPNNISVRLCIEEEQASYDLVKAYWPRMQDRAKTNCAITASKMPRHNYLALSRCLSGEIRQIQTDDLPSSFQR